MRRPSPRRLVVACALLALAGGLVALPSVVRPAPARADGIDDKQKQVEAALKAATSDLDDASSAATQVAAQLTAVTAQLAAAQAALAQSQARLAAAQVTEQQAAQQATEAQAALDRAQAARDVASDRVVQQQGDIDTYAREIYENGTVPDTISILATATDPSSFVQKLNLINVIAVGQQRALVAFRGTQVALQAAEQEVAERTQAVIARRDAAQAAVEQVAAITASRAATTQQLATLQAQRSAALDHAEGVLAAQRAQVAQLTTESNQIAALIQQRASKGTGTIGKGGLLWPATGPVTSGFGYRLDPVTGKYALHAGVDIGAPEGADIHAAKAGTVIFAGQETGYGNYTCIDHGGGFSTCYAHQSLILVHVGEVVAQGQVIGHVGHTGYATGPHLHFETRVNGNPVDPMQYF